MFRLYSFSQTNGHGEFVVISEEPIGDVRMGHETENIHCDEIIVIAGDASMFPCDWPLCRGPA